jgi:ATP-dependent DNA helicase RecQ
MSMPATDFAQREDAFTARDIDELLRERFGLSAFHAWQKEAILALLGPSGPRRVLVVAPTGGGKSLTYQFPGAVLAGTTLVISPLIALMEDQVRALEARGIPSTFLASTLDFEERRRRERAMELQRYKLVYVAPERLASEAFIERVARIDVPLVAIDEAHCISHWGHDFRPDYLRIGALLRRLLPPRVLACTATATPQVRGEIARQLGLAGAPYKEVLRGFARPNLHLAARWVDGPRDARAAMLEALRGALGDDERGGGAIVYAATRKSAESHASFLRERGYGAVHYHAGAPADDRARVSEAFAAREVNVVVATNAFGMGIDRPDIRAVVHVQPPASIEAYYQEVGRAGRDGAEAHGLLLCSGPDIALRRRLAELGSDGRADPKASARQWALFRELIRYLDARSCRHDFVLRYFGDEQETLGGCGHCDVCLELDLGIESAEDRQGESTELVRMGLAGIARANKRAGLQAVADMLHGAETERTRRFRFNELSTFGLMRGRSHQWIVSLLRALLAAGWIDLTATEHPVPFLTPAGREVMLARAPARILLPREPRGPPRSRTAEKRLSPSDLPEAHRPTFEKLRAHRAEVARARGVPPYVVAHDRTLAELAVRRPRTLGELSGIFGLGPSRIEQYGAGLLDAIATS